MLVSLLTLCLCDDTLLLSADASGFTTVALKPNTTLKIELAHRTAVIIDAEADSFLFTVLRGGVQFPESVTPFPYSSLLLTGDFLTLRSATGALLILNLWLLPPRTCGFASALVSAEHSLSFQSHMQSKPVPICLFSQTRFDRVSMNMRLNTNDPDASLTVFGVDSAVSPIKYCGGSGNCKIESRTPFFVRLLGHPNRSMGFDTKYKVVNPQGKAVYCSLLGIPELLHESFHVMGHFFGGAAVSCQSRAVDALVVLKWFAIAAFIGLCIAIALQAMHVFDFIDFLFPDLERRRFNSLKQNPYASAIEPGDDTD